MTLFINLNYFTLHYLRLFMVIFKKNYYFTLGYFWLLKVISPYVIIGNYRLL
jgi:hypothetical protein